MKNMEKIVTKECFYMLMKPKFWGLNLKQIWIKVLTNLALKCQKIFNSMSFKIVFANISVLLEFNLERLKSV